jgi:hypothetical protein
MRPRQIDRPTPFAEGTPAVAREGAPQGIGSAPATARIAAKTPAPRLDPNLAEVYREKVAQLADALMKDDAAEARERVRALVEAIVLMPEDGRLQIEVRGELAAILLLADGAKTGNAAILGQQSRWWRGLATALICCFLGEVPASIGSNPRAVFAVPRRGRRDSIRRYCPRLRHSHHRAGDAVIGHQPPELIAGVLAATIGVMDERIGLSSPPDRHHQGIGDELGRHVRTHRPADRARRTSGRRKRGAQARNRADGAGVDLAQCASG